MTSTQLTTQRYNNPLTGQKHYLVVRPFITNKGIDYRDRPNYNRNTSRVKREARRNWHDGVLGDER